MIVFRLSPYIHAQDLSGRGARMFGGRWNSKGIGMIYTSATTSLSLCEKLVHINKVPDNYVAITYYIPDEINIHEPESFSPDWSYYPYHPSTIKSGDNFITENKRLIMKVPSAIIHTEFNYLINPTHKEFSKVKIQSVVPFSFDRRLLKK